MTTCPNGHDVDENLRFCPSCGQAVATTPSTQPAPTSRHRTWMLLAVLIPVAIAALVCGVLIGSSSSSSSSTTDNATTVTTETPLIAAAAAWPTVGASLPDPTLLSSIRVIDGTPTVITGDGVPSGAWKSVSSIAFWEFRAGQWSKVLDRNIGLPISGIQFVDLTGDEIPEVLVHGVTGSGPGDSFVFRHSTNLWSIVPFSEKRNDSPGGPILFDSSPNFYSTSRNCVPSCAQGGSTIHHWSYDPTRDLFAEVQ